MPGNAEMTRILIVDDERACRESLRLLLSLEDYEVATAVNGRDALKVASSFLPDVVIVDWLLEDRKDGLQVSESLRDLNGKLQTIVVTGYLSDELEHEIRGVPSTAYLAKPFRPAELLAAVRQAAEKAADSPD